MSFKPVIGVFVSDEKELKTLLDNHPYRNDKIISDRKERIGRLIKYDHYDLHVFYNISNGARGYRFSNIIISQSVKSTIKDNGDIEGILYNFINPFGYFGANINVVDLSF